MSGFLAVEAVSLQPPDLSENDRVLLLVGIIIAVLDLFFSFTFALLLSFLVLPDVRNSAPSRQIPFKLLGVKFGQHPYDLTLQAGENIQRHDVKINGV